MSIDHGARNGARLDTKVVSWPLAPRSPASIVMAAALLSFFVISLDGSVVNVALPTIQRSLNAGMAGLQWIVDGYILMFAAMMLSAGSLSDRIGATRAYAWGLGLFTAASTVCGVAPSLSFLVGARLVQGVAAAVMVPASLALIRQSFTEARQRARAVAIWTAAGAIAVAIGPMIGGLLTVTLTWRSIFFLNLPAGLVGLVLLARIPRSPKRPAPLDPPGQLSVIIALAALTFALIEGGRSGFGAPGVLATMGLSAVALAAFGVIEARRQQPMVPLSLFTSRTVLVCNAAGFALNAVFYGVIFLFGLYFQQMRGMSALAAGLMFLPMCGVIAFVNMISVRVAGRFGPRVPMAAGQLIMGLGALGLLAVGGTSSVMLPLLLLVPVGVGGGLAVPSLTAVLLESVESERAATAAALLNTFRQVGSCLGIAVFGTLIANRATFMPGLHVSLVTCGIVLVATMVATLALLPRLAR